MTVSVRNDTARSVYPPTAGLLAQLGVLIMLAASVGLGIAGWLAGVGFALTTWVLLSLALQQPGVRSWGPANSVTLARVTLVGGVAALVADSLTGPVPVPVLVGIAGVALLLDGVDGRVARRTGSCTRLGARFDVEADAALVLVLSVFLAGSIGWWVLAIGTIRYAFVAAARMLPWLRATLPPRWSRKAVAGTQGSVLVVATIGVLPGPLVTTALGVTLALLVWSFGRDIGWLWLAHHRPVREGALDCHS